MLIREVLLAQDLDSSVAEFILSNAEGILRNDMGRFETNSEHHYVEKPSNFPEPASFPDEHEAP